MGTPHSSASNGTSGIEGWQKPSIHRQVPVPQPPPLFSLARTAMGLAAMSEIAPGDGSVGALQPSPICCRRGCCCHSAAGCDHKGLREVGSRRKQNPVHRVVGVEHADPGSRLKMICHEVESVFDLVGDRLSSSFPGYPLSCSEKR